MANVIYAIDKPYDYLVPEELAPRALPGVRVIVPFGAGNRASDGILLAVNPAEGTPSPKLKSVSALLDEEPVLDGKLLKLALWMQQRCFCTLYDAVKAMLPSGLYFSLRDTYRLSDGVDREAAYEKAGAAPRLQKLLDVLFANGGRLDRGGLQAAFPGKDLNEPLRRLVQENVLTLETDAMRAVRDKTERIAVLNVPAEEALECVRARRSTAPLRYAVIELLCVVGSASTKELCYFTGASMPTVRSLEKSGLIALEEQEVFRRSDLTDVPERQEFTLNAEQQTAFEGLRELLLAPESAVALLYGVTGSGKTQVYLRLIEETLARGRTAMVLVPEIALTPQMLRIFTAQFGDRIAVLHSCLHSGERYDEWKRLRSGKADVVIGTRSAVFAPLKNLGLIVLDEEQESSYKSENSPRYHAREIAKYRCVQDNALLVLGSATPSVESFYRAREGIYHLFTLKKRYNEQVLPEVVLVDLKQELKNGNGGSISTRLEEEIRRNLDAGEQTILFLNRRGASRMVSCAECGNVPTCPRCSVHMTYHSANGRLMCHQCGHSEKFRDECPECGGRYQFIGTGTQGVETDLKKLFPDVPILRMDTDTVSARQPHEKILSRFEKEKVPILLGTQMVAKGLDFENVTLVGVIAADLSLYVDDFRAAERTFSLLTQVAGRAGRGEKRGRAVIQTYTPDNDVIAEAARQDYDSFYRGEIALRRLRNLPPFCDETVLTVSGADEAEVLRTAVRLRESFAREAGDGAEVLGPAPAAVRKVNNRYRYRVTVCAENNRQLRALTSRLLCGVQKDRTVRGISVVADVNPLDGA